MRSASLIRKYGVNNIQEPDEAVKEEIMNREAKNFFDSIAFRASRIKNEPRIMTEGTAQVASARENGTSRETGVVEKCEFIKALNVHLLPQLYSA